MTEHIENNAPEINVPMNTLTERVNKAVQNGYIENFKATKQGLFLEKNNRTYTSTEVIIKDFNRFEGESDPADNSIMYLIETDDEMKGILIDAYGTYSDAHVTKFIADVQEINKVIDRK